MEYLSWDLAIFSEATQYANLSIASAHVGLGQPQLSRIVAKLEEQFGLVLLDRETRRKSSWTQAALHLAEIYGRASKHFRTEVNALVGGMARRELRVGSLEGLTSIAVDFCKEVLMGTNTRVVHLLIHDSTALEMLFIQNDLDLIFTARELGVKKYRNCVSIGFQSLDKVDTGPTMVYSSFEFNAAIHKDMENGKNFVSNSLEARFQWLNRHGGHGTIPSPLRPRKVTKGARKQEVPVMAIAHDTMPVAFWNEIKQWIRCPKDEP